MDEGTIADGRKKVRGGRKITPENVRRTEELIAENPNITVREAAQHLNVSKTVALKLMRKICTSKQLSAMKNVKKCKKIK